MSAPAIIAYDSTSADEPILAAYDRIRAARVYCYSFDGLPTDAGRDEEITSVEAGTHDDMSFVEENWATTLEAVRTQLQLLLTGLCSGEWLDRGIFEHGLHVVLRNRTRLDGHGQQVLLAAEELLHIEWEQALAAYEIAAESFRLALKFKEAVETEEFRVGKARASSFLVSMGEFVDAFEQRCCDADAMERMVRTLAPTHEALAVKLGIIVREGEGRFAMPWIARDLDFLKGAVAPLDEGAN